MTRTEGEPLPAPDDTLTVALSLAKIGWPVFPVKLVPITRDDGTKAVDKRPLVRWLEGATTDLERIATWFTFDFPGAWVGVHTARAGIVVVDLDIDKGNGAGRDNLKAAGLDLPASLRYRTRSGGEHRVYAAPDLPEGVTLTIARDHPVPGVDIRAGNGLMVYYGPALTEAPALAPAPDWSIIRGAVKPRDEDGDIATWLERAPRGKPSKALKPLRQLAWADLKHDAMLEAVSEVIKSGTERGAATVYTEARAAYTRDRPDRRRDWDNAAKGSLGRHGLPPVSLPMSKAERASIAQRNTPAAVAEKKAERKADYRIAIEQARSTRAGMRILEDSPLAEELAGDMAETWAYARGRGVMRWNGRVWVDTESHSLLEAVRSRLNAIELEEHKAAVQRSDNKGADKARTLLSRNRARNVADLVTGLLGLGEDAFDAHPHLLNVSNGIVDLRTSKLMPHDPKWRLTKVAAAAYDPAADMTRWSTALEALPRAVADWMQARMGQAITGHTPDDDVMLVLQGGGSNGKSTLVTAPRLALGTYAATIPDRLLTADPGDHPTTLMTLQGVRFAVVEELPEGRNLNVKRLKDTVGTPFITARRMRQDDVTFATTHALMISTNYMPVVSETDHGTWRRLALVRFPYRFVRRADEIASDRDRLGDPNIRRYFETTPDAGVMRWLVEGARAWFDAGMRLPDLPKRVQRDTDDWRSEADPVLAYLDDRIVDSVGHAITADDLARDFNDYLERRGHRAWSTQLVNARFEGHSRMARVERRKVRFSSKLLPSRPPGTIAVGSIVAGTRAWVGIRFKTDEPRIPSEAERDAKTLADLERRYHD
jgi:putative DNA primase/helicase